MSVWDHRIVIHFNCGEVKEKSMSDCQPSPPVDPETGKPYKVGEEWMWDDTHPDYMYVRFLNECFRSNELDKVKLERDQESQRQ